MPGLFVALEINKSLGITLHLSKTLKRLQPSAHSQRALASAHEYVPKYTAEQTRFNSAYLLQAVTLKSFNSPMAHCQKRRR